MAAVLLYFRTDLLRISRAWLRSLRDRPLRSELDARLGWYIVLGTIPIGIFGVLFKDQIETGARDLYLIGVALIVLGLVLLLAEKVGTRDRSIEQIRTKDGLAIGFAQALALIPGVSRSGATITAGLFMGLDRPAAARFSFLLSVPAVVLSGLLELGTILSDDEGGHTGLIALVVATLTAFAFLGYRLYHQYRLDIDSLEPNLRLTLFGSVGLAILTFVATDRLFDEGGLGALAWFVLLAICSYGLYWTWTRYRSYE